MTYNPERAAAQWATWSPPAAWGRIVAIDTHAAGEPLRVILGGLPRIPGDTVLDRRRYAQENLDSLRTALMWEPRGHADMYGCIVLPPVTEGADVSVLFIHNEGFSTMCGHGIIAVTTVLVELGIVGVQARDGGAEEAPSTVTLGIDTPAGFVRATAEMEEGRVRGVRFENVPSFVSALDQAVEVPGLGTVHFDVAFGGAFYAYVDAEPLGLTLRPDNVAELIKTGMAIKRAVAGCTPVEHPLNAELGFLYGTIFVGPAEHASHHSRNVCVFADGEVDRSPTGTGVSGRVAIHHARGELDPGERITIESILGTTFSASVVGETQVGGFAAVLPEVGGSAHIVGRLESLLDPSDPLVNGFLIRGF